MSTTTIEVPDNVAAKWREEAEAETVEERRELRQGIDDLCAERDARFPALQEGVEAAEARYEEARAAVEEARAALRNALAERNGLSSSTDGQIRRLEGKLRETAPPVVEETRRWLDERFRELRRMRPEYRRKTRHTLQGLVDEVTHTTKHSMARRLKWIAEAMRDRLAEIELLAGFAEIREACAALREELPAISMEQIEG